MPIVAAKTSSPAGTNPLVKPAQRLVSHAFFGTILKQMHESPWRSGMFSGGQAGRNFESLLDDRLADRMANNHSSRKLVNSIVKKLDKKTKTAPSRKAGNPKAVVPSAPSADPVDAVMSNAAEHLGFVSQAPRIDLRG
ncbi:MAG: rod-binding protein [Tepidisphaeraceae bacterium]|jgi:Rod binding domain-containing protein